MERRPLAIKVANYPRYIRPQSGLTLADNVYEYYIEGGLTRFIAVFYGNNSEWVGLSARDVILMKTSSGCTMPTWCLNLRIPGRDSFGNDR